MCSPPADGVLAVVVTKKATSQVVFIVMTEPWTQRPSGNRANLQEWLQSDITFIEEESNTALNIVLVPSMEKSFPLI